MTIRTEQEGSGDARRQMGGTSLWRVGLDAEGVEANTFDTVTVDGSSTVWVVQPALDGIPEGVVRSDSPEVARFIAAVAQARMRIARQQGARRAPGHRPPGA